MYGQTEDREAAIQRFMEVYSVSRSLAEQMYLDTLKSAGFEETPESIRSDGLLPILQNVVQAAGGVFQKFLDVKMVTEQRKALQAGVALPGITPGIPLYQPKTGISTLFSSQNLPILGVVGIGLLLVLRGRKKGKR